MTPALLTTAQKYHGWGANITAVSGKRPVHKWKTWLDTRQKTNDLPNLAMWDHIGALGAISGVNGWRVIDIDKCSDAGAIEPFLAALGLPPKYRWVVRTGSGNGWAIWFRCDEPIPPGRLSAQSDKESGVFWFFPKPAPAFDFHHFELRWANCQTLLPPSQHPTGPGYEWYFGEPTESPDLLTFEVLLAAVEKFGINRQQVAEPEPPAPAPVEHSPNYLNGTANDIKSRLDIVNTARRLFSGDVQAEPGGELRILGHGGLLLKPDSQVFYNFQNEAGGDVLDLYGLAEYDARWDRNNPQMFKAVLEVAAQAAGVDLPQAHQNEVVSYDAGLNWQFFTLDNAYQPRPPINYFVDGIFAAGSLNIVYGAPGTMKSLLLNDMLVCVAAGVEWLPPLPNRQDVMPVKTQQRPVVWVDVDNGTRIMHERFEAIGRARNLPADTPLFYASMPEPWPDASKPEFMSALGRDLARLGVGVVVIDNFANITGGIDENKPEIGNVMANLRRLAEKLQIALILVHHQRKGDSTRGRPGISCGGIAQLRPRLILRCWLKEKTARKQSRLRLRKRVMSGLCHLRRFSPMNTNQTHTSLKPPNFLECQTRIPAANTRLCKPFKMPLPSPQVLTKAG